MPLSMHQPAAPPTKKHRKAQAQAHPPLCRIVIKEPEPDEMDVLGPVAIPRTTT
jgi:hypothetical protein